MRRALRALAVVVLALVAYLVIAPTGRYLLRAGWEEGKILSRRRPISALIADGATPAPLRAKLELVLAASGTGSGAVGSSRTRPSTVTCSTR